jgi:hypothetical protein
MKRLAFILALFSLPAFAQSVTVQWTRLHPQGFEQVTDWNALPSKPDPSHTDLVLDDKPGWIAAIMIGNHIIFGCDHYAVKWESDSVTSYCIRDDKAWYGDKLGAQVCSDSGAIFMCMDFGDFETAYKDDRILNINEFVPPPAGSIRHGKFMPQPLWREHVALWPKEAIR